MCNGATALSTQITGGLNTAVGAYFSAAGEKNNLNASANLADTNARIADLSAQSAMVQGQREEQAADINTTNIKEAQKTGYASNGIDLGSDTANRVLTSTDVMGEIDANTIRANAVRTAWGYKTQAVQDRNEALTKRASADAVSPFARTTASLLTSASQVSDSWYKAGKAGGLKGSMYGTLYDKMSKVGA